MTEAPLADNNVLAAGKSLADNNVLVARMRQADTLVTVVRERMDTVWSVPDSARWLGPAIRTNLLYGFSATPNLGLDLALGKHVTFGVGAGLKTWPRWFPWDNDVENPKKWKQLVIVPELRIWTKEAYTGWFFGVDGVYSHYNVGGVKFPFGLYPSLQDHRYQGDLYAAGLFAGHSWWLSDHFRLEALAGIHAGYFKAEKYECAHCGAMIGPEKGPVLLPRLGLNLAYNPVRKQRRREILDIIRVPVIDTVRRVLPERPFFEVFLPEVPEWRGVAGVLATKHPVLRPSSEYQPYTPDRILRKEEGALCVYFELNKSNLLRAFTEGDYSRDNGPVLDEIMHITADIMADTTSRVTKIQIVGLASVEGPQAKNVVLADARALALQRYIQDRLVLSDDMFETTGGGEAWNEFRDQVSDLLQAGGGAGLTTAQLREVLDIIDSEPDPDKREVKLKKLEGGTVYRTLLHNVLHDQRNSGYLRIYFDYVPDQEALDINKAIDAIEAKDYKSAIAQLEALRDDPRSDNAYATALWFDGQREKALEVLEGAAARGDADAQANLERMRSYLEALEKYNQALKDLQ